MRPPVFLIALALLAACAAGPAAAESAPQKRLIPEIESALRTQHEPWLESKAHYLLARAFAAEGDEKGMRRELSQIREIRDRRSLVRPLLDALAFAARGNDAARVAALIADSGRDAAWMRGVRPAPELFDPEFRSTGGTWSQKSLESTLCVFAARKLAAGRRYESLDKVARIPQCAASARQIGAYRLAALVRDGKYREAYELNDASATPVPAARIFKACAPDDLAKAPDFLAFLRREQEKPAQRKITSGKDFDKAEDRAEILRLAEKDGAAVRRALKDAAAAAALQLYLPAFEDAYLAGDGEGMRETAEALSLFDRKPAGGGAENAAPWWAGPITEARAMAAHPRPAGFALALKIKDARVRFALLKEMFLHLSDQKPGDFPGCAQAPARCIIGTLAETAAAEKDAADRDIMYGMLSEMARLSGDKALQTEFLGKIAAPGRPVCIYGSCRAGAVIPLALKPEDPEAAPPRPDAPSGAGAVLPPFRLPAAPQGALALALRALALHLNLSSPDFRDVSLQSDHATQDRNEFSVGILDQPPGVAVEGRAVLPCALE